MVQGLALTGPITCTNFWYSKTAMAQRTTIVVIQIVCEIKCGEVQTDRVFSMGKMIRSMHLAQICDRQMKKEPDTD